MLARSGEITEPCPVPRSLTVTTPFSMTPALSHLRIRRMIRRSPIQCSKNRMSHSWFTSSKNDWMSASSMKLTFLRWIPTQSASSASCVPRPGRNPCESPRNSSSRHAGDESAADRVGDRHEDEGNCAGRMHQRRHNGRAVANDAVGLELYQFLRKRLHARRVDLA